MMRRTIVLVTLYIGQKEPKAMKVVNLITFILVVLGAINWLLYGVMGVNLISGVFGGMDVLLKLVYFLVGLSGLHILLKHHKTFI
jgi:uncharacterized membrane protein YuzA (DUF378 family)